MTNSLSADRFIHPDPADNKTAQQDKGSPAGAAGRGEAAPGIQRQNVEAVNAKEARALYAGRPTVVPKRVYGTFRNLKWAVMVVALTIYYGLPWLRWDRGPTLPDQAFLIDFANQRLFFGPLEIWAQEFYYITGILVVSALGLFLVTAIAGRVWCGYACPQTVWTDLFISVERFIQGDRNARLRLKKAAWTLNKVWKLTLTHVIWLLISAATGGALIFYFRDAPTLAQELVTGTAPVIAYVFLGVFAVSTYLLGGLAREQVCIYMCPWPRIQGAMFDDHSLLVSYREPRGEPRGPHKKGQPWEGRGDCIDCKQCVVVCPVGIDIRDGPQLECIQCALCIDACNGIMSKIGRPKGLITYDTFHKRDAAIRDEEARTHVFRPRTVLYMVLIPMIIALMAFGWVNRSELDVNVLRDRNPLFVRLSDGGIRNGYTLKILNKRHQTRTFSLAIEGLDGAKLEILGLRDADPVVEVVPDDVRALKVYVSVPQSVSRSLSADVSDIQFVVRDKGDGAETRRGSTFRSPPQ